MSVGIELASGAVAWVDDEDAERVMKLRWYQQNRYAVHGRGGSRPTPGGRVYLHRFIVDAPAGSIVDHINGDGLDCRRANLRIGDLSLNAINRRFANSCGFRGVQKTREKFAATIFYRGKRTRRFGFLTAEDAALAYDDLAKTLHGSAAILNFGLAA